MEEKKIIPSIINPDICIACGTCSAVCPLGAPQPRDGKYWIDPEICRGCRACIANCPVAAISIARDAAPAVTA